MYRDLSKCRFATESDVPVDPARLDGVPAAAKHIYVRKHGDFASNGTFNASTFNSTTHDHHNGKNRSTSAHRNSISSASNATASTAAMNAAAASAGEVAVSTPG